MIVEKMTQDGQVVAIDYGIGVISRSSLVYFLDKQVASGVITSYRIR